MKTYFDLEKWESENRDRIGLYYRTRPTMPDNYDWKAAIDKAADIVTTHRDRPSIFDNKGMNLWQDDLPQMVRDEEVWEFFDYPEFKDVIERGSGASGHKYGEVRMRTFSLDPLKEFPASTRSGVASCHCGPVWPIWGVTDITVFPSQFNNMKTELDPHGIPYNLLRWWAVVTPRTERLKSHLQRTYLSAGSHTTWQRMKEAITYDLKVWSDNSRPRD